MAHNELDTEFKNLYRYFDKWIKKNGWKTFFFAVIGYQREFHKETPYSFKRFFKFYTKENYQSIK